EMFILRRDQQMKTEPPAIRMKFVRIATTDRPAVKARNELRGIMRGRPFRKVCHFNLNDGVEFQVALNPRDFGRVCHCRRTTWRGCRRRSYVLKGGWRRRLRSGYCDAGHRGRRERRTKGR